MLPAAPAPQLSFTSSFLLINAARQHFAQCLSLVRGNRSLAPPLFRAFAIVRYRTQGKASCGKILICP